MFDYDPMTMSPNPDGCEEELPFTEGDTIKVIDYHLSIIVYACLCLSNNVHFEVFEI